MAEQVRKRWVPWGEELRRIRALAGKTQGEIARSLAISRQLLGKLEMATRTPTRGQANKLDTLLATGGTLTALYDESASMHETPDEWQDFIALERAALEIREWQPNLIPGLLQTEEYARTVLTRYTTGADELRRSIQARCERLSALSGTRLRFILDEPVLARPFGGPEVMEGQLDHLLELIRDHELHIVVVPWRARWRPGTASGYRVATLPAGRTVVHAEYENGIEVVDAQERIHSFCSIMNDLTEEALPRMESTALIEKIRSDNGMA